MIKTIYIKSDFKQLVREPMMLLLFLIPLMIGLVFRLLLTYLVPFLSNWINLDISQYYDYILSLTLIMTPGMLGIVMGFMLLDDKDGKIAELMSITPLGRNGYLALRMFFVMASSFVYTYYTYLVLGIYRLNFLTLTYINILLCSFSVIVGLIFVSLATDKVKGLTYAKGLNLIMLFGITELLNLKWLTLLSGFVPTYWITRIVISPSLINLSLGLLVHGLWFILIFHLTMRRRQ